MKKTLLIGLITAFGASIYAQQNNISAPNLPDEIRYQSKQVNFKKFTERVYRGGETVNFSSKANTNTPSSAARSGRSTAVNEKVIGSTTYDLQTNSSIQNRLVNHGGGKFSAVWTYGSALDGIWNERGTGYVYNDGTGWGSAPTSRIESNRTGWPTLHTLGNGRELLIAHGNNTDLLTQSDRLNVGSGNWSETDLSALDPLAIWPRKAIGGPNDQTVHVIGLTEPVATNGSQFSGEIYNGMNGALLYSRSLDGGATYSAPIQLPKLDSNHYAGIGGDSYSIAARGNVVAVVVAGSFTSVYMWKSVDNGDTWTRYNCMDNGLVRFDETQDLITDTVPVSGGATAVAIDNNDQVHVFFDRFAITNDNLTDGTIGIFNGIYGGRIGYWNESMPEGQEIGVGGVLNNNRDNVLDFGPVAQWDNIPDYGTALFCSYPDIAIDDNNNIYMLYTSVTEYTAFPEFYRHTYATYSTDGGCSWTVPTDVTPGSNDTLGGEIGKKDFFECIFASVAEKVENGKLFFTYQQDDSPDHSLNTDNPGDPPKNVHKNDIIFVELDIADLRSDIAFCNINVTGENVFCIGDSVMLQASCGSSYNWSTGENTESVWVDAHQQYTVAITSQCGVDTIAVTTSSATTAPDVSISSSVDKACPGDDVTLTAENVSVGTYLWSTGETKQSAMAVGAGTYTVTATNCGGSSTASVTIGLPAAPTAAINGASTTCLNDSVLLTADEFPGVTYTWSNGDTTMTTYGKVGDNLTVTVANCTGSDNASIFIGPEATPATSIGGLDDFCEENSIVLSATGGVTYKWSNGATTPSIILSQLADSGDYTVTAFNNCGDSAVSSVKTISVYPTPAKPSVTFDGASFTFTSDQTGKHEWFISGATDSVITPSNTYTANNWRDLVGVDVAAVNVSDDGCRSEKSTAVAGISVGINEQLLENSFTIYPNPTSGNTVLETNMLGDLEINVYDMLGQVVYTDNVLTTASSTIYFDFTSMEKGVYFMTVSNGSVSKTDRLVVR